MYKYGVAKRGSLNLSLLVYALIISLDLEYVVRLNEVWLLGSQWS